MASMSPNELKYSILNNIEQSLPMTGTDQVQKAIWPYDTTQEKKLNTRLF